MRRLNYGCRICVRRFLQCSMWVADILISIVGPLLSLAATILILFVTYVYFNEILPALISSYGILQSRLITLLGLWLLGNLLFNYWMTHFMGPGNPPAKLDSETISLLSDDPECRDGAPHRFCRICNVIKPMRAHHCSICKKCVLKMDHHCPWVNTCVGWRNHKHFLLFLFYMCTGASFFLIITFDRTLYALMGGMTSLSFLISAVLCFSSCIATFVFLLWNIYLLLSNQSTIEFYSNFFGSNKRRNPFNLGVSRNVREVFGARSLWTILLPSTQPPSGDGLIFEMVDKDVLIRSSMV